MSKKEPYKTNDGYIKVYAPDHPNRNKYGYVSEHTLVMEKHLGCPIPNGCHVHHRDENRTNNTIENLLLMRNASDHMMLHNAMSMNRPDLVKAYEEWSLALMEKLKEGCSFEDAQMVAFKIPIPQSALSAKKKTILRKKS